MRVLPTYFPRATPVASAARARVEPAAASSPDAVGSPTYETRKENDVDTDIERAVAECPSCHQPMRAAHVVCQYCVTDGALKKGRDAVRWGLARNKRYVEAVLWS